MKKSVKKNMTIDDLAIMVAKGFSDMKKEFSGEISDLRDVVKSTRQDVLNIGDKFVHRYEFDSLVTRFSRLERKVEDKSRK